MNSRSLRAARIRPPLSSSVRTRWSAAFLSALLAGVVLTPARAATAADVPVDRDLIVYDLVNGGPSVRRAAEAALVGSEAVVRSYVDADRAAAQEADERAAAQVLAGMDGPSMRTAALQALDGSRADVQAFVNGGWESSWTADERLRVFRVLESGEQTTRTAAQAALSGTAADIDHFLQLGAGGRGVRRRPAGRHPDAQRRWQQQRPGAGRRGAGGPRRHP